jgi:hypothetical protein
MEVVNPQVENNIFSNGYHGGFQGMDTTLDQLQKCSDNTVDMKFSLNTKTSLDSDKGVVNAEIQQSMGAGYYHLDNTYGCECGLESSREVQLSQPYVNFDGGKGWMGEKGCMIDNDSDLRFETLTNKRYINILPERHTNGFMGKGNFNVDVESTIHSSNLTSVDKSCNVQPESNIFEKHSRTFDHHITPMIPKLKEEIQRPDTLIPEDSMESWVRGGLPTRQIIRNSDYLERCQKK